MRFYKIFIFVCLILIQYSYSDGNNNDNLVELNLNGETVSSTATSSNEDSTSSATGSSLSSNDDEENKTKKPFKKSTKDWSKLDFNTVEKQWEGGDEKTELEHEFELNRKIGEKVMKRKGLAIDIDNPESVKKLVNNPEAMLGMKAGSGAMAFVELNDKQSSGKEWTKEDEDKLASRYASLLRTNSLSSNIYNIGHSEGAHRFLAQADKGWQTLDIIKFLVMQPDVQKVTLDNKEYTKSSFPDLLDDDDE